jgi:hypothetical protein
MSWQAPADPKVLALFLSPLIGYGILFPLMSTTSSDSPILHEPVGTTFKVAASLLAAFLVLQIAGQRVRAMPFEGNRSLPMRIKLKLGGVIFLWSKPSFLFS